MENYCLLLLGILEVATPLFTEAVKKVMNDLHKDYNATALALIMSVVLSAVAGALVITHYGLGFTLENVLELIVVCILNFVGATVGYDKVKELFNK